MSTATTKGPKPKPDRMIPTHPDWLWLSGERVLYPDLCFLTTMAVGHRVMVTSWPLKGGGYLCAWHEWEREPLGHSYRGEAFWIWWHNRKEAVQDTPERACIAYVIAYRRWIEEHPEEP